MWVVKTENSHIDDAPKVCFLLLMLVASLCGYLRFVLYRSHLYMVVFMLWPLIELLGLFYCFDFLASFVSSALSTIPEQSRLLMNACWLYTTVRREGGMLQCRASGILRLWKFFVFTVWFCSLSCVHFAVPFCVDLPRILWNHHFL